MSPEGPSSRKHKDMLRKMLGCLLLVHSTAKPASTYIFYNKILVHPSDDLLRAARLADPDNVRVGSYDTTTLRQTLEPLVGKLIHADHLSSMMKVFPDCKISAAHVDWSSKLPKEKLDSIVA